MEAYLWDDALMDSAMNKAGTRVVQTRSDNDTLSSLYILNPSRIPVVDPNATVVGEIVFNATRSFPVFSVIDAMNAAIGGWTVHCTFAIAETAGIVLVFRYQ